MNPRFLTGSASALLSLLALASAVAAQPASPAPAPAAPEATSAATDVPAPTPAAAPVAPPPPPAAPSPVTPPAPGATVAPLPLAPLPQFDSEPPSRAAMPDIPIQTGNMPAVTPTLQLWLGFHNQLVATQGLDPFSEDDQVPTFHIGASLGVSELENGQLALVGSADFGGTDSSMRGQSTDLSVQRFGLGPELRFPLLDRLYVFGRVAPQAVHVSTEIEETSSGVRLGEKQWSFALDAALGASVRIAALRPSDAARPLAVFIRLEAGYLWSPALDLDLSPVAGDAPVRTAPLDFGELALRGISFGGGLGVGY